MEIAKKEGADDSNLVYMVFDAMTLNEFQTQQSMTIQSERSRQVKTLTRILNDECIQHKQGVMIDDWDALLQEFQKQMDAGYEGLVIKDANAVYAFKRSKCWNKVKAFFTVDGTIKGFVEGTGKYKGSLGKLEVDVDGITTGVGSGFDDSLRKELWDNQNEYLDACIEFKAQEKTEEGKYRFPVFLKVHIDR